MTQSETYSSRLGRVTLAGYDRCYHFHSTIETAFASPDQNRSRVRRILRDILDGFLEVDADAGFAVLNRAEH